MSLRGMKWKIVLGVVVILLLTPQIVTMALVNWASILFWRSEEGFVAQEDSYPYWREQPDKALAQQSLVVYRKAYQLNPSNEVAKWGVGRAAMAVGKYDEAAEILAIQSPDLDKNPVRYIDTIVAKSLVGQDDQVLQLAGLVPPPVSSKVISDTIAISYMRIIQAKGNALLTEDPIQIFEKVLQLRPNDLFANYYLWHYLSEKGDLKKAEIYRQRLVSTPAVLDVGADERLLSLACQVFPDLVSDKIWEESRAENILGYWIWKQPSSQSLMQMLEYLTDKYPEKPGWPFYLGELYHRRGQPAEAKKYYQQSLALGVSVFPVERRLADVGITTNISNSASIGFSDPAKDRSLVANLLGIAENNLSLGDNILGGDAFVTETVKLPQGWSYFSSKGNLEWPYVTGRDALESPGSVRVINLWWPQRDEVSPSLPRAGYKSASFSVSGKLLMVSGWFRVTGGPNASGAGFLIGTDSKDWKPYFKQLGLPNTDGKWARLVAVGPVPEGSKKLFVLVNNIYDASTWWKNIEVRPIDTESVPKNCTDQVCLQFLGIDWTVK